ncbi:twin-arginine translocase TatA/TatE family subunit [Candidatus Contubernalis alkaliaceticus]|uniref:twin-arginine translocase TatA/TatE family subunit n=1 Tax=Candidatus Contubernalis alkaliaceticus TaxID=338645 RepID=UPI001F4BE45C|nr:twin-arginine translocase TatA/TatE family subunit [Candidatus Contubernalis alkalaceticus]
MIGRLGTTELLIILGVVLVIFGPSKLPELGKSLGKGIREFRGAAKDIKDSINIEDDEEKPRVQAKPEPVKEKPEESSSDEKDSTS